MRGIHYWSANLLVLVVLLHTARVVLTGGHQGPRRFTWLLGTALLLGILASSFTGYLLPWDQLSYWAVTIATGMLGYVPLIGEPLRRVALGGETIGDATLVNFYTVHTTLVPVMLLLLAAWHFWRVRRAGGVVVPPAAAGESDPDGEPTRVMFWPELMVREIAQALVVVAVVMVLAALLGAPLGERANPGMSPNPAKAPWYFVGFQELLIHLHPVFAVLVLPLLGALGLVLLPWLAPDDTPGGRWFLSARGRRVGAVAALMALIVTPLLVVLDEQAGTGSAGWLAGGVLPLAAIAGRGLGLLPPGPPQRRHRRRGRPGGGGAAGRRVRGADAHRCLVPGPRHGPGLALDRRRRVNEVRSDRRGFLKWLWTGLGLVAAAELVWVGLSFLRPRRRPEAAGAGLTVCGPVDDFAPGSVTAFPAGSFYLGPPGRRRLPGPAPPVHPPGLHRALVGGRAALRLPLPRLDLRHHRAGVRTAGAPAPGPAGGAHRERPGEGGHRPPHPAHGLAPGAGGARVNLRRWELVGLAALAVIVVTIPASLALRRDRGPTADTAPAFVGSAACVDCHQEQFRSWRGSDHDLAMDVAADSTVLGDFDDAVVTHEGVTSRFYRRDGRFLVETEGPDGAMAEFEITHVFGHDPLQQYLIPFPGGRLQTLNLAWDRIEGRWFGMYPGQRIPAGDWLHWTRGGQNWNGMCAECHSTDLKKGYDPGTDTYTTTWSDIDVGCEACHGPGSGHVAWAGIPPMARPEAPNGALAVATADLEGQRLVELCAPCHSRRAELGDYDHTGGNLLDHMLPSLLREGLYEADGQIRDEVYVYGSFLQSRMHAQGVRCSDCHDSHSLQLVREGNALCLQCHEGTVYDTADHHFHKQEFEGKPSDGALCVKCHMVERPFMVDRLARRPQLPGAAAGPDHAPGHPRRLLHPATTTSRCSGPSTPTPSGTARRASPTTGRCWPRRGPGGRTWRPNWPGWPTARCSRPSCGPRPSSTWPRTTILWPGPPWRPRCSRTSRCCATPRPCTCTRRIRPAGPSCWRRCCRIP